MADKVVYFLRPVGEQGPIKIGCSIAPTLRLRSFEIWSPVMLEIAASAPGENVHERMLHYRFSDWRLHGEWFRHNEELDGIIRYVAEHGVLPQMDIPSYRELNAVGKGKMSKRDTIASSNKNKITSSVWAAEKRVYGFGDQDWLRPKEVAEIIERYHGYGSPMPDDGAIAVLDEYIAMLRQMPKADRSMAAWRNYWRSRTTGNNVAAVAA